MEEEMNFINYTVALPIVLGAFSASAWDSLTPQEAFEKCYAGDTDACTVARAYQQNQELYASPYDPHYVPRPWSPADQWVPRDELWQEKPGPFSPGELAR
jgi:hypothetical protein